MGSAAITAASLHSDQYRRSPEPIWEALRNDHPIFYDDIADLWLLTRYRDVAAVFADHETYSAATYELSTGRVLGPTLISRDDYGHVVRRSIVAPDFVGKRLQRSLPMVQSCATDLIDRFIADGQFDLVSQFSARLPVDVISAMLGMEGDGDLFRRWVTDMIQGLAPDTERRALGKQAHAAFCAHIAPALQGIDDPERMDHIAKIARAEIDGHRLDSDEVTAFCGLLFIAGGETTDKAIANMWLAAFTSQHEPRALMDLLQAAGVPAGMVQRSSDNLQDPQLAHRDFFRPMVHPEMGEVPYEGHQYKIAGYDNGPRMPAPCLGEHTYEVLTDILGIDVDEVTEILVSGACG